jgi:hypothetical protein
MLTTTHRAANGQTSEHYRARITLRTGRLVGQGSALTADNARYNACADAIARARICARSKMTGHAGDRIRALAPVLLQAACGHARYLSAADEASIRREAAAIGAT